MHVDASHAPRSRRVGQVESPASRWSARADLVWPVEVVAGDLSFEATTANIGPYGAFVRCPQPLGLNEIVELSLKHPSGVRPIRASARVIWSKKFGRDDADSPHGMGVQFCDIAPDDHARICEAVREHCRAAELGRPLAALA